MGNKEFNQDDVLMHHGVKGMKWGVRRYQNADGSLTSAGKSRARNQALERQITSKYKGLRGKKIMSREDHYARNQFNTDLPKTLGEAKKAGWHTVIANAHQYTKDGKEKNVKYVDPTGKKEAMYGRNGKLITNALDMGSYNYSPSGTSYLGHLKNDIMPWLMYGNAADDPSTAGERVKAIMGVYTKRTAQKGKEYIDQLSEAFNVPISSISDAFETDNLRKKARNS